MTEMTSHANEQAADSVHGDSDWLVRTDHRILPRDGP